MLSLPLSWVERALLRTLRAGNDQFSIFSQLPLSKGDGIFIERGMKYSYENSILAHKPQGSWTRQPTAASSTGELPSGEVAGLRPSGMRQTEHCVSRLSPTIATLNRSLAKMVSWLGKAAAASVFHLSA